jgi:hypothetical protein
MVREILKKSAGHVSVVAPIEILAYINASNTFRYFM